MHLKPITAMKIKSEFQHGQAVPVLYTCLSKNINPPLEFEAIPAGTKSMVLIIEDVDATPRPWTHWMVINIPPHVTSVAAGTIPGGATEGLANNHSFGYEGPCPKYFRGTHHYWFRLYALDIVLDLPAASEREVVEEKMQGHILEQANLLGLCTAG
jgi:Raf kinase inhibitor-like YbhB/YbcL family protein